MPEYGHAHGQLTAPDTLRFERQLPGPLARVWSYLLDPGLRCRWLAGGDIDPCEGGHATLVFRNAGLSSGDDRAPDKYREHENAGMVQGRIIVCEPPRLLVMTWTDHADAPSVFDSEVSFELTAHGDANGADGNGAGARVHLVLTHARLHAGELGSVAAAWHTHLGLLDDQLHGRAPRPFWRTHARMEAEYLALGIGTA